jgi:Zn finger protein HypA/HybF involved in hydrogenase expression
MHLYLSCGNEFNVDSQAPRGDCSECRSRQISRTFELGSKPCPYCTQGTFVHDSDRHAIP